MDFISKCCLGGAAGALVGQVKARKPYQGFVEGVAHSAFLSLTEKCFGSYVYYGGAIGAIIGEVYEAKPSKGLAQGVALSAIIFLAEKYFGSFGFYVSIALALQITKDLINEYDTNKLATPQQTQELNQRILKLKEQQAQCLWKTFGAQSKYEITRYMTQAQSIGREIKELESV